MRVCSTRSANCGWLDVSITLAPTSTPRVQSLFVQSTLPPGEEVTKAVESVMRLMGAWDQKAAESLAGTGFDVERMRKLLGVASQWGAERTTGPGVPKPDRAINTAGGQRTPVRAECDRRDPAGVAAQSHKLAAGFGGPDPGRPVVRRGGEPLPAR